MTASALREFIERHEKLFVLTGAGCSTASGIPDYRDADGEWKRGRPIMLAGLPRARAFAQALLGARLDRLEAHARRAAERRASRARRRSNRRAASRSS